MPRFVVQVTFILTLLTSSSIRCEDSKKLSQESAELVQLFGQMKSNPMDSTLRFAFLNAFPKDKDEFIRIFHPEDLGELYDSSYEYVLKIGDIMKWHKERVGPLLISITRDGAPGCCDAWSWLHGVTTEFALQHTSLFMSLLDQITEEESELVIEFIADKENHYYFEKYQLIIDKLKEMDEILMAKRFDDARIRRKAKRDH